MPKTRIAFWSKKFEQNQMRDARNEAALKRNGWQVLTIWECETHDPLSVRERLLEFLGEL